MKNIQEKVLSFVAGLILGGVIIFGYGQLVGNTNSSEVKTNNVQGGGRGNFDVENMGDAQLESMAERIGITKEELQKKLDAGENIRDLLPARGGKNGAGRGGSGATQDGGEERIKNRNTTTN